ncbi:hypothetical protein [Streptomyces sp. NPDC059278]|uniref:hypothetical protein n=1 Tax=Streptomyces sp. NPDC059278 TaxID=3346801 RepID=UPI00369F1B2D
MTTPSTPPRRRGKGTLGLLTGAAPGAPESDTESAPAPPAAPEANPEERVVPQTGRAGGRLPSGPLPMLPRNRAQRVVREKLTVNISVSVLDGLAELVQRDGTRRYDEVEEALRNHLARRNISIEED